MSVGLISAGRALRAILVTATLASLVLLSVSCTRGGGPEPSPTASSLTPVPGSYSYDGGFGVTVTLAPKGSDWLLSVKNATGHTLGKPGIYALAATTGFRIDATVAGAAPIPDGGQSQFQVSFSRRLAPEDMGLVLLLFGGENFGPLAPPSAL